MTFIVFGAVLLGPALDNLSWAIAGYAVLSLTVVRMLPVAVAMLGTQRAAPTVAFVGWFGPRGLATIVFVILIVEEASYRMRAADHRDHHHRDFGPGARAQRRATGRPLRRLVRAAPTRRCPHRWKSAPTDVTRARGPAAPEIDAAT